MVRPAITGPLRRNVRHDAEASVESAVERTPEEESGAVSGASVASELQGQFGNAELQAALSGVAGGLRGVIMGRMAEGVAGLGGGPPSNRAMLRLMREAEGADAAASSPIRPEGGAPLPTEVRTRMESAFGHDFGHVRIHTDSKAAQAAEDFSAHAFAVGSHIWFGAGEWSPGTPSGDRLIAHELTHVVQHDEGRLSPPGGGVIDGVQVSSPTDSSEVEAYQNEGRILARLSSLGPAADEKTPDASAASAQGSTARRVHRDAESDDGTAGQPSQDFDIDAALAEAMVALEQPAPEVSPDVEPDVQQEPAPSAPPPVAATPVPPFSFESLDTSPVTPPASLPQVTPADAAPAMTLAATAFTPTVDTGVPQIEAAHGAYLAEASRASMRIQEAMGVHRARIETAASGAADKATLAAERLREHVSGTMSIAIQQVRTDAEAARRAVHDSIQLRLAELEGANKAHRDRVLDRASEHAGAIRALYRRLADEAEAHGETCAENLSTHAATRAQLAHAAAAAVTNKYKEHGRANDIRLTVGKLAKKTADNLLKHAVGASEELRKGGRALAEKLRADGEAYARNITEGDEDTRRLFAEMLEEARQTFDGTGRDTLQKIDELEQAAIGQLETVEESLLGELGGIEEQQLEWIEQARADALTGIETAGWHIDEALYEQVLTVEAWLDKAHPSQWPEVVHVLGEITTQLAGQTESCLSGLGRVADGSVASFDTVGNDVASVLAETASQIDARIAEVTSDLSDAFDEVLLELEASALEQFTYWDEGWAREADGKIVDLDEAWDEARNGLERTGREGIAGLDEQYGDAVEHVDEMLADLRTEMCDKAEEIANQSTWDRILSGAKQFGLGLVDALVGFVKAVGIVLLVVVLVVLVVAAAILFFKGAAALAAVIGAVAAAIAAASKILAFIGFVLTIVGLVFAAISLVSAWLNPNLTTDEKWRATGKAIGDAALEILPDLGVDRLVKLLRKTDTLHDAAKAADTFHDAVHAGESAEDVASAAQTFKQATSGVEELAEVGASASKVAESTEDLGRLASQADEAAKAADALGNITHAGDAASDAAKVGDAAADAAHAGGAASDAAKVGDAAADAAHAGDAVVDALEQVRLERLASRGDDARAAYDVHKAHGFEGKWEPFQAAWNRGLRLDGRPRRWKKPETIAAAEAADAAKVADEVVPPSNAGAGGKAPAVTGAASSAAKASDNAAKSADGGAASGDATQAAPGGPTYDPEKAPDWLKLFREAARKLEQAENGRPILAITYDYFKGLAVSAYQAVTAAGPIGEDLAVMWLTLTKQWVSDNQEQAEAIEQESSEAGKPADLCEAP